jgi:hypothetical protein
MHIPKEYVMHSKIQLPGIQLAVPLVGYMFLKECYCGKETSCKFVIVNSVTKALAFFFLCVTGPVLISCLCDRVKSNLTLIRPRMGRALPPLPHAPAWCVKGQLYLFLACL